MPYIKFKNNQARKRWWLGEDGIQLITSWRRNGITLNEIRDRIGIAQGTFDVWRQESKELDDALMLTDDLVDGMVEGSLFKRAMGYDYEEETYAIDETGRKVLTRVVKKHVPADVKAIAMWLYNRRQDFWRSQQQALPESDDDIIDVKNVLVQIEEVATDAGAVDA